METIHKSKWHDPIVVGFCVVGIVPFFVYGAVRGWLRELREGRPPPCTQIKGGLSDDEIIELRKQYTKITGGKES